MNLLPRLLCLFRGHDFPRVNRTTDWRSRYCDRCGAMWCNDWKIRRTRIVAWAGKKYVGGMEWPVKE